MEWCGRAATSGYPAGLLAFQRVGVVDIGGALGPENRATRAFVEGVSGDEDEMIEIVRGLLATGRLRHSGRFYRFEEVTMYPVPPVRRTRIGFESPVPSLSY